jgi:hypothetical protein
MPLSLIPIFVKYDHHHPQNLSKGTVLHIAWICDTSVLSAQCIHTASNRTINFLHAKTLSVWWSRLPLPLECLHTITWLCFMYYKKKQNVIWVTCSQTYLDHEQLHLLPQELGTCQFKILRRKQKKNCKSVQNSWSTNNKIPCIKVILPLLNKKQELNPGILKVVLMKTRAFYVDY